MCIALVIMSITSADLLRDVVLANCIVSSFVTFPAVCCLCCDTVQLLLADQFSYVLTNKIFVALPVWSVSVYISRAKMFVGRFLK